jgi:CHAT domain-containing protein/tetratricopeptide (TPR) repeat protein
LSSLFAVAALSLLSSGISRVFTDPKPPVEAAEQARSLLEQARYQEAESLVRAALEKTRKSGGAESAESIRLLDLLVEVFKQSGKAGDPEGRRLAQEAVEIKKKVLGLRHAEVGASLRELALLLEASGDYPRAGASFAEALAIQVEALGPDDLQVARTLNDFAELRRRAGDYPGAGELLQRALEIRSRRLGEVHPDVAATLNEIGLLHLNAGEYGEARRLFERALAINRQTLGPSHPAVANNLTNLGILLGETGDYAEGRQVFTQALEITEKALGPTHPKVGRCLNNLARSDIQLGEYEAAKPLLERSLKIREEALGPDHPDVAQPCLNNLGRLNRLMGDLDTAETYYRRSLAIQEKRLKGDHPHLAETLQGLGRVLKTKGDLEGAEACYRRAAAIQEGARGAGHPYVAQNLVGLAEILARTGRRDEALETALRAEAISREHLQLTSRTLPERQALQYAENRSTGLDVALSLLASGALPSTVRSVWDAVIRSRAGVLDEFASRRHALADAKDPEVAKLAQALATSRSQLAHLIVQGSPSPGSGDYLGKLAEAGRAKEAAERSLAEKSAAFRREQERSRAGLREVVEALPSGATLLAFARYRQLQSLLSPRDGAGPPAPAPVQERFIPYYAALILTSSTAEPKAVALGPAAEIEALVRAWRVEAAAAPPPARAAWRRSEMRCREAGKRLRAAVWDPVLPFLPSGGRLFLVPEGLLHLINAAALPIGEDSYLLERPWTLHHLSAERDLIQALPPAERNGLLLAVGAPAFDALQAFAPWDAEEPAGTAPASAAASSPPAAAERPGSAPAAGALTRGASSECREFKALRFEPLPSADLEVREIADLWRAGSNATASQQGGRPGGGRKDSSVIRLSGPEATEAAVKSRSASARVLHVATHGFFLGDCPSALGIAEDRDEAGASASSKAAVIIENPLLLSGLALAGANRRGSAGTREEDGILTAEEIASLNLEGLEWAVLSGCDTGLGRVLSGEGVLGLRRAFQTAGARTLIMSLWPADDQATRQWMKDLYRGRQAGLSTAEAVRGAQIEALRRRRDSGKSTHPFFWGTFVASGGWE